MIRNAVLRCDQRMINDGTYRSAPTACRSDKWPHWLKRSKDLPAYSKLECELNNLFAARATRKFDLRKTKYGEEREKQQHSRAI